MLVDGKTADLVDTKNLNKKQEEDGDDTTSRDSKRHNMNEVTIMDLATLAGSHMEYHQAQ